MMIILPAQAMQTAMMGYIVTVKKHVSAALALPEHR